MRGLAALAAAFQAEGDAHLVGEVGLHLAQGCLATDQLAGVQLAAGIEGDDQELHVGGGLVAVNDGRKHVVLAVAGLEPAEGLAEVGVLLGAAHDRHLLGAGANEVFQGVHGVLADLLGGTGFPGGNYVLAVLRAFQDGVLVQAVQIGVRGMAFAEVMAERRAELALGLDLAHAQDGIAAFAGGPAALGLEPVVLADDEALIPHSFSLVLSNEPADIGTCCHQAVTP